MGKMFAQDENCICVNWDLDILYKDSNSQLFDNDLILYLDALVSNEIDVNSDYIADSVFYFLESIINPKWGKEHIKKRGDSLVLNIDLIFRNSFTFDNISIIEASEPINVYNIKIDEQSFSFRDTLALPIATFSNEKGIVVETNNDSVFIQRKYFMIVLKANLVDNKNNTCVYEYQFPLNSNYTLRSKYCKNKYDE